MSVPRTVVYVGRSSEVPKVRHWAITKDSSKDDGYGSQTPCIDYVAYLDKVEWEAEIIRLEQERFTASYAAFEVTPAVVERKVVVALK